MSKLVPVAACLAGIALLRFLFLRDETHNESQATFNAKKVTDAIENALNLDPEFTVMTRLDDRIGFHCTLNSLSWGLHVRRSPAIHDCEGYEIRLSSPITQRGGELIGYFHPESSFASDVRDNIRRIKHAMAALIEANDRKNMDESIASTGARICACSPDGAQ